MRVGTDLGRYRLLEPLGRGGMAEVWKARTQGPAGFEHDVVIKRIQPAHGADPEFIQLFLEEARISAMLHHSNTYKSMTSSTTAATSSWCRSTSRGRRCRALCARCVRWDARCRRRSRPSSRARFAARSTTCTRSPTARAGPSKILHRYVTPSNILLTANGDIKLLDFGVAKYRGSASLTRAGTMRGKPAYLAPQQIEGAAGGAPIDRRVDIFALGVVLHEMLSLEHLFAGDSDLITVKKVLEMKIPLPSRAAPTFRRSST